MSGSLTYKQKLQKEIDARLAERAKKLTAIHSISSLSENHGTHYQGDYQKTYQELRHFDRSQCDSFTKLEQMLPIIEFTNEEILHLKRHEAKIQCEVLFKNDPNALKAAQNKLTAIENRIAAISNLKTVQKAETISGQTHTYTDFEPIDPNDPNHPRTRLSETNARQFYSPEDETMHDYYVHPSFQLDNQWLEMANDIHQSENYAMDTEGMFNAAKTAESNLTALFATLNTKSRANPEPFGSDSANTAFQEKLEEYRTAIQNPKQDPGVYTQEDYQELTKAWQRHVLHKYKPAPPTNSTNISQELQSAQQALHTELQSHTTRHSSSSSDSKNATDTLTSLEKDIKKAEILLLENSDAKISYLDKELQRLKKLETKLQKDIQKLLKPLLKNRIKIGSLQSQLTKTLSDKKHIDDLLAKSKTKNSTAKNDLANYKKQYNDLNQKYQHSLGLKELQTQTLKDANNCSDVKELLAETKKSFDFLDQFRVTKIADIQKLSLGEDPNLITSGTGQSATQHIEVLDGYKEALERTKEYTEELKNRFSTQLTDLTSSAQYIDTKKKFDDADQDFQAAKTAHQNNPNDADLKEKFDSAKKAYEAAKADWDSKKAYEKKLTEIVAELTSYSGDSSWDDLDNKINELYDLRGDQVFTAFFDSDKKDIQKAYDAGFVGKLGVSTDFQNKLFDTNGISHFCRKNYSDPNIKEGGTIEAGARQYEIDAQTQLKDAKRELSKLLPLGVKSYGGLTAAQQQDQDLQEALKNYREAQLVCMAIEEAKDIASQREAFLAGCKRYKALVKKLPKSFHKGSIPELDTIEKLAKTNSPQLRLAQMKAVNQRLDAMTSSQSLLTGQRKNELRSIRGRDHYVGVSNGTDRIVFSIGQWTKNSKKKFKTALEKAIEDYNKAVDQGKVKGPKLMAASKLKTQKGLYVIRDENGGKVDLNVLNDIGARIDDNLKAAGMSQDGNNLGWKSTQETQKERELKQEQKIKNQQSQSNNQNPSNNANPANPTNSNPANQQPPQTQQQPPAATQAQQQPPAPTQNAAQQQQGQGTQPYSQTPKPASPTPTPTGDTPPPPTPQTRPDFDDSPPSSPRQFLSDSSDSGSAFSSPDSMRSESRAKLQRGAAQAASEDDSQFTFDGTEG